MKNYEVYEDNGGGLYLCIMSESGECERIFENWEYANEPGILKDAIQQLESDEESHKLWDGDLVDRLQEDGQDVTAQSLYDDGLGNLIASNGYLAENMGLAGRKAFELEI